MKKKILLLVLLICFMVIPVKALDHLTGELIPKAEESTVDTNTFKYQGITYADDGNNGVFNFKGILNKTSKQIPMSINILLFDENRVNIGFVSYCTEKDLESNYSQEKINSSQTKPLSIKVSKKYIEEGKKYADVAFYSILNANEYCQVGGYDKYLGLTIEEVLNGKTLIEEKTSPLKEIMDKALHYVPIIVGVIALVVVVSIVAKVIKKVKSEKMVNNVPRQEVLKEPERIRKQPVKEEELTEENNTSDVVENNTNTFVKLNYDEPKEQNDDIVNDSALLANANSPENTAEVNEEVSILPKEKDTFSAPQENLPPVENATNEGNELMDLFK